MATRDTYALLIAGDETPDLIESFELRKAQEYFKNRINLGLGELVWTVFH